MTDQLDGKALVIFHAGCNDGQVAAWIAATALRFRGWPVRLHPAGYRGPGQPEDLPDLDGYGRDDLCVIADFSYRPATMLALCERFGRVDWLDHHKSAIDAWDVAEGECPTNLYAVFDTERCGALITWEAFRDEDTDDGDGPEWADSFFDLDVAIDRVDARDRWLKSPDGIWDLDGTEEVFCALAALPRIEDNFDAWTTALTGSSSELIARGAPIVAMRRKMIDDAARNAYPLTIDGHQVHVANVPYALGSDVAEALNLAHPNEPFSGYWFSNGRELHFGLRSDQHNPNAADVAEIAQRFGGGGHKHAAGFRLEALRHDVSAEDTVIL